MENRNYPTPQPPQATEGGPSVEFYDWLDEDDQDYINIKLGETDDE